MGGVEPGYAVRMVHAGKWVIMAPSDVGLTKPYSIRIARNDTKVGLEVAH